MKMVTYKVLSKAMRELTGQVAELAEHLAKAAELVNNFKYAGYTIVR